MIFYFKQPTVCSTNSACWSFCLACVFTCTTFAISPLKGLQEFENEPLFHTPFLFLIRQVLLQMSLLPLTSIYASFLFQTKQNKKKEYKKVICEKWFRKCFLFCRPASGEPPTALGVGVLLALKQSMEDAQKDLTGSSSFIPVGRCDFLCTLYQSVGVIFGDHELPQ